MMACDTITCIEILHNRYCGTPWGAKGNVPLPIHDYLIGVRLHMMKASQFHLLDSRLQKQRDFWIGKAPQNGWVSNNLVL